MDTIKLIIKNTTAKQKVLFLSVIIIFVAAIIVVSILLSNNNNPAKIKIINFSEYSSAPQKYKQAIENATTTTLELSYPKLEKIYDAEIRKDSYKDKVDDETHRVNFLLDIPELEQSYVVNFTWTNAKSSYNNDTSAEITCPRIEDMIYENSTCRSSENPIDDISKYLPHVNMTESGAAVRINIATFLEGTEHPGERYLSVLIRSCKDEGKFLDGQNYVIDWIKSLDFKPEDFYYNFTPVCGQI